ncbi:MAG TPA: J domain-containing protein, partial [Candidatus Binatia bacterium]|nr:J domain-containing protein [Candidatus Binatia bacterium]
DSASAHVIKRAYRLMAKRWHPDLYPAGTPEQVEASRMMEHINEAYSTIKRAPLRYAPEPTEHAPRARTNPPGVLEREPRFPMDRFEFWVRFAFGCVLGIFISAGLALRTLLFDAAQPTLIAFVVILIVLGCGFGAARGGDRFWYAVFGVDR